MSLSRGSLMCVWWAFGQPDISWLQPCVLGMELRALERRQHHAAVKLLWFIWRLPGSLCESCPNCFWIHWPFSTKFDDILRSLNFLWISFMQVSGWLQERNLLRAVTEERQPAKSRSPSASENPHWNNALNTHLLCQKTANLQIQFNKKQNSMSFGAVMFS